MREVYTPLKNKFPFFFFFLETPIWRHMKLLQIWHWNLTTRRSAGSIYQGQLYGMELLEDFDAAHTLTTTTCSSSLMMMLAALKTVWIQVARGVNSSHFLWAV